MNRCILPQRLARRSVPRTRGDEQTGRYNETLADIITNTGAMERMKELRKLAPGSINIVGAVLAGVGL